MVLGCDGGNHKLLVTLAVFDLDNPELEGNGFMSGGTRRSLIIAAADKVSIVHHALCDCRYEFNQLEKLVAAKAA